MTHYIKALAAAGAGLLLAASAMAQGEAALNQIVVRDADTGALRAATAAEARSLARAGGEAVGTRAPLDTAQRSHASGARGVRLSDQFMSYSVTVRQPDGKMLEFCFESREQAEAAQKAVAALTAPALATE